VVALVTESACIPKGNPDGLPRHRANAWHRYPLGDGSMKGFTTTHGGFDTTAAMADPRRLLPADAARHLEASGRIGRLHDVFFSTTGNSTPVATARRMGAEMARELTADGVLAAILTAT
jgi:betaine reductase